MISDFKTNFDFFNQVVNEQITKVRESTIDEDTLQKIKTKLSADDVFNNKLRDNTIKLLENTILKDEDASKPRSKSLYTPKMETIMKSNPLGKHFQDFVVELFEIAQSSEMLKYTLKFIIDTILKVDKYKTHTFNIFLCYLVTSNNEALYPEDYAEHADFISKFCSDYILLKKYTNFVEEEHLEDVYVYMTTNEHKQSILTHGTLDTYENLAFSNAYAVTNNGWILLTHYTEVLVQDGSVLSNNTFSDFHKKVIFKNIEKCLKEYKISDLDYLDYLIRVLATMLKKNTTKKLIDKKLRNLVVYLSESGFGARNKDNIIYSLARQFVAGVSKFSTQKTRDGYIDSRDSRSMAPRRDEIDEQNQLNMGFAWVSLIFIHEGIFALKSLLDVFSNYNKTNEVLLERLSFYFRKNNVDYTEMLKQEDAASSENALSAASLLTASRDEEFTRKEGEKASLEVTEIPKKEKESRFQISVEEKSNDTLAKIPIKTFPQVLLLTAFLEVQCFKEASYIISCFKLLLSGNSELEELFSSVLNSYGKELIGEENISNEDKIANNSYYWLFTTPGTLNIESSRLSLDDFVKVGTILISNGNDPKSIKSTFDSFTTMLYHYKKLDDERTLESLLNPLINCVINELIPRCMLGSKTISKHLYSLLKHLNSEIRYEVYDIFTKKVISENSTLKEINVLQQKQIKRFLKVVNVDNLSSQLEKLAVLVNINPFITLTNCLNLAESYDMISNLLIQSMKHFTDFSLDVLQYTILKRLKIDRPFFTEDEGLALPWFAKICSLLTNGFNSFSKFSVYDIFDFCLSKIIAGDFTGVYILDALITGSSDCLYLDDVQDELAILYSGNEETKKIALEKTDAIKKQKTHKLMRMLTKKKHGKSHALIILESLSGIIFEIFYDSFQTVNKINNNYDIVVRVQKLIIDILAHNRNQEVFAETFHIPNIITNPSLQYLSDAWKALLLRNSSRKIQKDLLPKLSDHKSLFEFFWYHSLADLNTLAISHMPENLRGSLDADMFSVPELKGFDNFKEKVFSNDQLQQFLEICLLKNSLLGVAEAIYSAEFVFRILSEVEITKLLGLIFNNKFISKAVIGISSNESKFFAAFIKRIFMILPTYYTTLEEDKLQIFKTSVVSFMKSFSVELSDLVLDDEYINCRNAIQILSESIKFLPPIDIFVKILVDAIEKRLLNESRKELLVPLNAVVGFSKTKLKECERVSEFSDVELDEILKELDEILQLSKEVIQENIKLEQLNDDLSAAEAEKQDTIERLSEKKVSIEQESIATKRFNDGEDLRKDTKRIKLNYEENADDDASKSTTAEVGSAAGSRFEGFGNTATTEKSASPVPKTLVLPTQPKSKVITNILEQLENPDFKRYIESKISNDIRPHAEFNMKRNLEFLEQALVADSAYLSYVVPTLKFFRLSRLVDALLEVLTEKPEYFMNGFLYSLLHVFTFNGRSENKQLVLDLWNKTEVASHLKITLEEMKTNWHKLNNLKTLVYDRQWVYTFVEQIDILVQYLMTKRENQFSDQTVYLAFIQKEYPESAFSRYTEESQGGYREGGRREGSRRDRSRREGDRERSRFSEDAPSDDLRRRGDRRGGDRSREDRHLDDRPREDRRGGDRSREDRRGGDRSREDRHLDDRPREDRRGGDRSREDRRGGDRSREDRHLDDRPREDRRGGDRSREDRHLDDRPREDRRGGDRSREDRRGVDRPREDRRGEDRRDGDRPREDRRSDDRPREDRRGEDRRGSDRPREDRRLDDRPREDRRGEDRFTDGRRRESRPHDDRPSDDLRNNSGYDRGYNSNNRRDESESRFNRRQSDRSYSYRDSRRY